MAATVHRISPILPVADVRAAADFYCRHLGFEIQFIMDDESYAVVVRDDQAVHLTGPADEAALTATRTNMSMFLWVDDCDAAWEAVAATAPATKTRPPEEMPWGVREFHILDLDGALLRFGADIDD